MKQLFFLLIGLAFSAYADKQPASQISFTENKGQICDQNYKPRQDVLFSGTDGQLAFHIKNNGISYQLFRVDTWKEEEIGKTTEKIKVPDKTTIYRIDANWVNVNKNFEKKTQGALPGTSNYCLEYVKNNFCSAKSYESVTLKNLYDGIDVHYYEKNNVLKYDYIVHPHFNYKQIQIKIGGANVKLNTEGELLLVTPMGTVSEGKPLVYQNGKELKSRWLLNKDVISFEVDNYDPQFELVIDPPVRLWGTYYGGTGNEGPGGCATDLSGNVYLAGNSTTSTSGVIATSGSHQVSFAGSSDAFLVKFNTNGVRQWATYYGGAGADAGYNCTVDKLGNVYMVGTTSSSVGTAIATPGAHQAAYGGSGSFDGFLVKFTSAGIRVWGTYYGGTSDDYCYKCVIDKAGNICVAGKSSSSANISTPGSHQPVLGGGTDGFLVKFNSAGVRQWGTYYGGAGASEEINDCDVDTAGNVYIVATPGSYQSILGGGYDGFLVKFNPSGTRQWGTYYGGSGTEQISGCTVDSSGYVYLSGHTASVSLGLSTPGSHQPSFAGGSTDGIAAKFDLNGNRIWATYYGGTGNDYLNKVITDKNGNVYFIGYATPTSTNLATPGTPQVSHGGGLYDGIIAMFNKNCIRQWGSFYGGTGNDFCYNFALDTIGNLFLHGYTTSSGGIAIATSGSHQTAYAGGTYDDFLVKFNACPFLNLNVVSNSPVCSGSVLSFSATTSATAAVTYSFSGPNSFNSISQNPTLTNVSPLAAGVYTVIVNNGLGCFDIIYTSSVTVNISPFLGVNSGVICSGNSFTIAPGGAATYTFINGGPVVTPTASTNYSVIGTSSQGCPSSNTVVSSVVVSIPVVSVTPASMCYGNSFTISPTGASTYTYTGGSPVVNPTTTTSYTITGTDAFGCTDLTGAVLNLTVNPLPVIALSTSDSLICGPLFQETVILSSSGASTYTWNTSATTNTIVVSPSVTTTYSVTGTDANGCENTAMITQSVSTCIGVNEISYVATEIAVFPNPTKGTLKIVVPENLIESSIEIFNSIGESIYRSKINEKRIDIDLSEKASGIYFVRVGNVTKKIVKE